MQQEDLIIPNNLEVDQTNIDYPANIRVQTKAKRYQNSVRCTWQSN